MAPFLFMETKMTPNTTLHKIKYNDKNIIYRDLTVLELSYFQNIKNEVMKKEFVARTCIIDPTNTDEIPWPILQQVGHNSIEQSIRWVSDKQLFEILVKKYRNGLSEGDSPLAMIKKIIEVFPGQSITELLNLTWKDLIELVCLAEEISGKFIFNISGNPRAKRKGAKLATASDDSFDQSSLQQKMDALNATLGGVPK